MQTAQIAVACFPVVPDWLGVAAAVGCSIGRPESEEDLHVIMQLTGYVLKGCVRDEAAGRSLGLVALRGLNLD